MHFLSFRIALVFTAVFAAFAQPAAADPAKKSYVVTLKDDNTPAEVAQRHNAQTKHTYRSALRGFAAELNDQQAARLEADDDVASVTPDEIQQIKVDSGSRVSTSAQVLPFGVRRIGANVPAPSTRVGVAVMDTGVAKVSDLRNNLAKSGHKSCVASETSPFSDGYGHGTHVAGTIGAVNNSSGVIGVNPNVSLYAVKVYDAAGYATWSDLLCGVDYLAANAARLGIRVVNMSLAGPGDYTPFRQAIAALRDAGVTIVVAAGNSTQDATSWNPAGYEESAITVSAMADSDGLPGGNGPTLWAGMDDAFAWFSNYGSVVDCAAPGVDVLSTLKDGGYGLMSGTSMAAPHVAGLASRIKAANPNYSWTQVREALMARTEPLSPTSTHTEGLCRI